MVSFGRKEDVPGAEHVGGHDLSGGPAHVMGDGTGVDDGLAALNGSEHRFLVEEVLAVGQIEGLDSPTSRLEHGQDSGANPSLRSGEQYVLHGSILVD